MKVNGKELKMFYSIGAYARISDLCPNHSYSNLKALLAGNYAEAIINITMALQDAYYAANPEDTSEKVTRKELESLKQVEFDVLDHAVADAMNEGGSRSVETKESKKKAVNPSS